MPERSARCLSQNSKIGSRRADRLFTLLPTEVIGAVEDATENGGHHDYWTAQEMGIVDQHDNTGVEAG
jgi:hypothetical protein